jgi:cation transport protein ChaC
MRDELQLLWRREMVTSAYRPKWVNLRVHDSNDQPGRTVRAIAFVMDRNYPNFEGNLSLEQTAGMLSRARGPLGTSAEYLFNTQESLLQHGIRDAHLTRLARRVQELIDIHGEP